MKFETLKLDIGGVSENGGLYAPYKSKNGEINIDTEKKIAIAPGEDLPNPPSGYDGWVSIGEGLL